MISDTHTVFISYSRHDAVFARELSRSLAERGLETWFDEEGLSPGESFSERLQTHLREADSLVVLLSGESSHSPSTFFELGAAMSQGKKIFPVLLSDSSEAELPPQLRSFQAIRARHLRPSEVAERIVEAMTPTA